MMRNKAGSRTAMSSSSSSSAGAGSSDNNNNNRSSNYGESSGGSDHRNNNNSNHNSTAMNAASSQLPLPRSAADMFKAYTNGLEFGTSNPSSANHSSTTSSSSNGHTTPLTAAASTSSNSSSKPGTTKAEIVDGAKRLAKELDDFIKSGLKNSNGGSSSSSNMTPFPRLDNAHLSDKAVADLQLATARKLRELLPTNRELLHVVQERNWIPLLLSWLNLHDRPAVQVEALLALTNMAELCAQQTYYQHAQQQQQQAAAAAAAAASSAVTPATNPVAAAAAAAAAQAAAVAAMSASQLPPSSTLPTAATLPTTTTAGTFASTVNVGTTAVTAATNAAAAAATPATYPYPSLVSPPQASVPFPPLSFSQTLSPEAVAAFDASLTSTIQQQQQQLQLQQQQAMQDDAGRNKGRGKSFMPPSPLFPSPPPSSLQMPFSSQPYPTPTTNAGVNFTSIAPGATAGPVGPYSAAPTTTAPSSSSSSSSSAFLPPPTPVPEQNGKTTFPQQLSTSSQHLLLRHADAIPTLISLLASPNREVYEQALWILGSIAAGDSPGSSNNNSSGSGSGGSGSSNAGGTGSGSSSTGGGGSSSLDGNREKTVSARDVILAAGVMNHLPRCLERHPNSLSLQRIGSWTLSNLVEGIFQQQSHGKSGSGSGRSADYSSSDEIHMETLLPILHRLLHMADAEVLSYTCWTLSHLCDGPSSHIAAVVTSKDPKAPRGGLVPRLVDLLLHPSWRVTKPALRTIGNIVCAECSDENNHSSAAAAAMAATADYTEVVLECGAVPRLKELVTHSNREIQKEACWTLSNIAAGTIEQIQAVIDSGAIPPLVKLVSDKKTDQEVRSEACWVVLNATSCGSDSQIEVLVDEGCVSVLSVLLTEASMAMMALEGLERVLQVEEAREMTRREQIESGEIDDDDDNRTPTLVSAALIEKALEKHNSSAVTKRAGRIWKQHFVSCALCHKSFSKHRTTDATFCEECKCYVCCSCDCKVYHLSYQEELWAATEEKTEAKKNAKKSKNKKKKEKLKQKKSKKQDEPESAVQFGQDDVKPSKRRGNPQSSSGINKDGGSRSPTLSSLSDTSENKQRKEEDSADVADQDKSLENGKSSSNKRQQQRSPSPPMSDDEAGEDDAAEDDMMEDGIDDDDDDDKPTSLQQEQQQKQQQQQPDIDFVKYLQQTGSIIALAKLMDALEYGDNDEEFDDADLKSMIRQHQLLNRQQQQATI